MDNVKHSFKFTKLPGPIITEVKTLKLELLLVLVQCLPIVLPTYIPGKRGDEGCREKGRNPILTSNVHLLRSVFVSEQRISKVVFYGCIFSYLR